MVYGTAPALNAPYLFENSTSNQNLLLDVFEPSADTAQKRALIIFAHSGGFLNGTKDNEDMQALCDSFAHRGYVTASLEYRLGFNPLSSTASERAVWRGVQDGSAAVRFFKENATLYKIDTTKIFIWGSSAGAFLALGLAHLDDAERPASTYSGFLRPDLGCKDCAGNSFARSSLVAGIISCWGATKDTAWIQNNNNIPVQLFHGTGDATVPYTEGYPFGLPTITYVRGSQQINEQLNRTSVYHEFYSEAGLGHEYWGTSNGTFIVGGPTAYWLDIIIKAKDFLLGRMPGLPVCVLPVKLTAFTGDLVNEKVNLYWNTSNEFNLKEIIVERSSDGILFTTLNKLLPLGNNVTGHAYQSTDTHPFSGSSFYRLRFNDMDGNFSYSNIIRLATPERSLLVTQYYPNPVHNLLQVQLQSDKNQTVQIGLYDLAGKQMREYLIDLRKGLNTIPVSFEGLSAGIYFARFSNERDGYKTIVRIIKQ